VRRRSARGAAVVDVVLVTIVLVPLVLGVLQLGLVLYVRNTLASAASEGARYAATLGHGPADGTARAQELLRGALSQRYADGVSTRATSMAGAPAIEVTIRATVPALGLGGPAVTLTVRGHAVRERP
jgi:Flp pilus assembly protein TadG